MFRTRSLAGVTRTFLSFSSTPSSPSSSAPTMMYDPLVSGFADDRGDGAVTPPWPTTPHPPNSPVPNLRRAPSPLPRTPDKLTTSGLYGKEPQIYGQPEPGLISPRQNVSSNGVSYEKPEPYLKVRITGLDRNRRDILVKLDAQASATRPLPFSCERRRRFGVSISDRHVLPKDEPLQLHGHHLSQRLALVPRVPAVLRYDHTQQPPNDCPRPSPRPDLRTDR